MQNQPKTTRLPFLINRRFFQNGYFLFLSLLLLFLGPFLLSLLIGDYLLFCSHPFSLLQARENLYRSKVLLLQQII